MANGLTDGFEHYLAASDDQISEAVRGGMVVVDTNVLLDAYRFAPQARSELFGALDAIGDRLWVPQQVALEFHKNRIKVITEHDASYAEAVSAIREFRERCDSEIGGPVKALAKRIALEESEADRIIQAVSDGLGAAARRLDSLRKQHGITASGVRNDSILAELQRILEGKVGPRSSREQEEKDRAEASRRINEKVPPGYQDRRKADPHGDYLLWRQALTEAEMRKVPLVFVTRDVKEDWFLRVNGQTVGARPELIREAREVAGVLFIIMTTQGFLHHTARELNARISAETLRQAEVLTLPSREYLTVLDPETSSPRRIHITPQLLEFVVARANEIIDVQKGKVAGLKARHQANLQTFSVLDDSSEEMQILLEANEIIQNEVRDMEAFMERTSEFIEWVKVKAASTEEEGDEFKKVHPLLKTYATFYLQSQKP